MKYIALILIFFIAACQKNEAPPTGLIKVKLQLNWMPEAEHGGYYEALLKNYYKDEGLELEIIPGGPGVRVETETALDRVQFGIANADKILIVRDKGMKLSALMSPCEKSPRCLVFHSSLEIKSFNDISKAKVLILNNTKPFYHWLKNKYPDIENIDTIPYNKATFMSNKNAGIQGYTNSEPIVFKESGLEVDVLEVSATGFNPYASVLICSENTAVNKKELVAKMKRASVKGWLSYLQNPASTNSYIESINPAGKGTLNKSTEELKKLMSPDNDQFGKMRIERWQELAGQLKKIGLISKLPEDWTSIVN